eukprot:TRINITY_DN25181_c1_g2_i2.p7 TRINITY_DN25181_c1_g2~~TRINITY_DN25181_c1_g2_i2.p7  ORF type:complete len:114 (+),score=2.18 TRINITY_DN25181_c1_g2_i2:372-713(+)
MLLVLIQLTKNNMESYYYYYYYYFYFYYNTYNNNNKCKFLSGVTKKQQYDQFFECFLTILNSNIENITTIKSIHHHFLLFFSNNTTQIRSLMQQHQLPVLSCPLQQLFCSFLP